MTTTAIDPTATIGVRTVVWDFARILAHVNIGDDCSIGGGTEIGRGSLVGNRSRIGANCFLPSNSLIGECVFIGPGVTCTDDRFPHVPEPGDPPYHAEPPIIEHHANIGAGCVILPGIRIGHHALIGAGSVVSHDVAPHMILRGEPARIVTARLTPASHVAAGYDRIRAAADG